MARDRIVPCLWIDDQAEEAADFYVANFPGVGGGVIHGVREDPTGARSVFGG
jgi:predicted 3-demethylubiquinone-9 3-methyltransferase (glyoxalase superfamily)